MSLRAYGGVPRTAGAERGNEGDTAGAVSPGINIGYNTGEFGKNHLGDHTASLPTAHGFQEYWGYLYHLDAMQGVSFPDIDSDPFEQAVGIDQKSALGLGGALAGPVTAFLYDWNLLPIGQQLWLKHLESYIAYPPLQEAESYNLSQVIEQVKKAQQTSAPGE
jgi:hypothetical protein